MPDPGRRHVPREAATTKRTATSTEITARIECAGSVALMSEYMAPSMFMLEFVLVSSS